MLEGGCCGGVEDATEPGGKDCLSHVACYGPYVIAFSSRTSATLKISHRHVS